MLDVFGFPTPQGANYQEFYGGGTVRDWIKPRGASMVRMLLIGAGCAGFTGGVGSGGPGGGSGAITQWVGPAIFIPDVLRVSIGAGGATDGIAGGSTTIVYQQKDGTGYTLLTANGGASRTAGAASSNNYFGAAGIFRSVAGQDGSLASADLSASTLIFLCGGTGGASSGGAAGGNITPNYGYPTILGGTSNTNGNPGNSGFFITQPIMLGVGGSGGGGGAAGAGGRGGKGGIGCGGGGGGAGASGTSPGGSGGDGAVFIWSW